MNKNTDARQRIAPLLVAAFSVLAVVGILVGVVSTRNANGQGVPPPSVSAPSGSTPAAQPTTPPHIVIEHGLSAAEIASKLAASTAEYVLVKHPDDLATARSAAIPLGKLVLLLKSQDAGPGLRFLDRSAFANGVVRIYHDIPKTVEQARSIHGGTAVAAARVSDTSLADTRRIAEKAFAKGGAKEVVDLTSWPSSQQSTLADQLAKRLANQGPDDIAVVMGHVDGQGLLRLHDNSAVSLQGVSVPGMLWVVGCNSAKCLAPKSTVVLGMTKVIGYSEAIQNATELSFATACRADSILTKAKPRNKDVLEKVQKAPGLAGAISLVGLALVLDLNNLLPVRALKDEGAD